MLTCFNEVKAYYIVWSVPARSINNFVLVYISFIGAFLHLYFVDSCMCDGGITITFYIAAVPLISGNICKELGGVDPQSLGGWLMVPQRRLKQESTRAEQMKATIDYWLSVDTTPSWRRLLWALVVIKEDKIVEKLKSHLEQLTGK